MRNLNKKWVTLVELMMVIAIGWVLLTGAGMAGWNVYQNSIDNGIRGDLKALSNATTAFMTDTNGIAPCFSPLAVEWGAPATWEFCADSGYDYIQWRVADTATTATHASVDAGEWFNLDYDSVGAEVFTPNNILVPTYIENMPDPRRAGQAYVYTKWVNTTAESNSAFAYSAILSGPKAQDTLNDNVSLLNVADSTNYWNTERKPWCTTAQVSMIKNGTQVDPITTGINDATKAYTYKTFATVVDTAADTWIISADAADVCDIYSDGQGLRVGNFSNGATSYSITVNN